MKVLIIASLLLLQGCGSIVLCAESTNEFQVPSTVPFLNGAFKIKRSSDHVDCERDPDERGTMDD